MALEPITRQEKIIAGQDLTPITRMEMFLKEFGGGGGGGGGEQIQTDWNQNDDTQPDFLKNRPFGAVEVVILEEQELTYNADMRACVGQISSVPNVGDNIEVTYDGVAYETVVQDLNGNIFFGNGALVGGPSDTGEPFTCIVMDNMVAVVTTDTTNHTVKISIIEVEKLPHIFYDVNTAFYSVGADPYIYTDSAATVKATYIDVANAINKGGIVINIDNVIFVSPVYVSLENAYARIMCSVALTDVTLGAKPFYTAEYTPTT